jgi:hypothetical protein
LKVGGFDDSSGLNVPGVQVVVSWKDNVAVLATTKSGTCKGVEALRIDWKENVEQESSARLISELFRKIEKQTGDTQRTSVSKAKTTEAVEAVPTIPHAPIERIYVDIKEDVYFLGSTEIPEWARQASPRNGRTPTPCWNNWNSVSFSPTSCFLFESLIFELGHILRLAKRRCDAEKTSKLATPRCG